MLHRIESADNAEASSEVLSPIASNSCISSADNSTGGASSSSLPRPMLLLLLLLAVFAFDAAVVFAPSLSLARPKTDAQGLFR